MLAKRINNFFSEGRKRNNMEMGGFRINLLQALTFSTDVIRADKMSLAGISHRDGQDRLTSGKQG